MLCDGLCNSLDRTLARAHTRTHTHSISHTLLSITHTHTHTHTHTQVYAEHLYSKGNFNDAIAQYIKTIGSLEPSYVIRKFLDSQRIHNLTAYLKALHDEEQADRHHTTLLLNCYTKLKDKSMLDSFIMTDKNLNFDLETAIKVRLMRVCALRESGLSSTTK
jgi:hypothetical protein